MFHENSKSKKMIIFQIHLFIIIVIVILVITIIILLLKSVYDYSCKEDFKSF